MRHRKTRRPSAAQLAAIGKIDAECKRLGAKCCQRPEGIAEATWLKCYELGYIETVGRIGRCVPLVKVGSHGIGWLHAAPKEPQADCSDTPPTRRHPVNKTTNPDGKIHRHVDGGYYCQCATLLDDRPAVVTFRIHKGFKESHWSNYWATEATVRLALEDSAELPVYATPHGSRVVKNGFTKKQAADVFHQVREGYVTRLQGTAAFRKRFAPDVDA